MKKVTITQVAQASSVDKATVSRALRGDTRISRATKDRVWYWAKKLGYQPDEMARGLSGKESGLVALCMGAKSWDLGTAFVRRALYVAQRSRLNLVVYDLTEKVHQASIVRQLKARRIMAAFWEGDLPEAGPHCPLVVLGGNARAQDTLLDVTHDSITSENFADELGLVTGRLLVRLARMKDEVLKQVSVMPEGGDEDR